MKYLLVIFFTSIAFIGSLTAQSETRFINQTYAGQFLQLGFPLYELPEGDRYVPLLIGAIYHIPFWQTKNRFNMGVDLAPQFGLVFSESVDHEMGLNVLLNFNYELTANSLLSAKISSGPHFITLQSERQAEGYIFSDNFLLTYRQQINNYSLGIAIGVRHISNAGLMQPNLGVDNFLIGFEFGTPLSRK